MCAAILLIGLGIIVFVNRDAIKAKINELLHKDDSADK